MEHLHQLSYQQQVEREEGGGSQWGKMGKEFYGESILGLAIFPIFPHFSPFKKNFEKKTSGRENRHKDGEKWGKMGKEFYGESILRLAIFPIFPHFSPLAPPPPAE